MCDGCIKIAYEIPHLLYSSVDGRGGGVHEGDVQSSTVLNQDIDKLGLQIDPDENDCPDEVSDTLLETLFEQDRDSSPVKATENPHVSDVLCLSRRQLIMEQSNDTEIAELRENALSENEIARVPVGYFLKDKVLMRK